MGALHFGIPTPMEISDIDSLIALCKELGCSFVELNTNFPLYQHSLLTAQRSIERIYASNLAVSIHLPEVLDVGSFPEELRQAAVSMIAHLTQIVEAKTRFIAHMNSGILVSLPNRNVYVYEQYASQYHERLALSAEELEAILAPSECTLCMENIGNFRYPFIQKGLEILIAHKHIGLAWDWGHDATASLSDSSFFHAHTGKVREIHLHDSLQGSDHRPLFSGNVATEDALRFASEHSLPVVVEVKTLEGLRSSFSSLAERNFL